MPNPKGRFVFHLRFWLICAALLFVIFIPIFRTQEHQAQTQREELTALQQEQYAEAMRAERLNTQLDNAETDRFREREARRRYDYVMPGVIRFKLDGAVSPQEQNAAAQGDAVLVSQPEQAPDKDWGNFN